MKQFYTITEVSQLLSFTEKELKEMIENGILYPIEHQRTLVFLKKDIDMFEKAIKQGDIKCFEEHEGKIYRYVGIDSRHCSKEQIATRLGIEYDGVDILVERGDLIPLDIGGEMCFKAKEVEKILLRKQNDISKII